MNRTLLILQLSLTGVCMPVLAQAPSLDKPLTEAELMKTIDGLDNRGGGGPRRLAGETPRVLPGPTSGSEKAAVPKKEKGPTEITALEATFDQKTHQAVFLGNVVVKDPEFNVNCDKLTAYLKNEDKAKPPTPAGEGAAKPPATPPKASATPVPVGEGASKDKDKKAKGGGLDRAIAEANPGGIVLITQEKVETDGTVNRNVGRARKAVYEASTGEITLTGKPEVSQGINTCIALSDETVMTLNREGKMKVTGPHKTMIRDSGPETAR